MARGAAVAGAAMSGVSGRFERGWGGEARSGPAAAESDGYMPSGDVKAASREGSHLR
jgi:hypothetical protein